MSQKELSPVDRYNLQSCLSDKQLQRAAEVQKLRWKKFPLLDDGFVTLVDVMGDDLSVVQAARCSYGKDSRECGHCQGVGYIPDTQGSDVAVPCGLCGGGGVLKDVDEAEARRLIRYLKSHRHTTPFEMVEIKLLVRVPMDVWRQWIRHRTASVNEYSTRYTVAIDSCQKTQPDQWRAQSKDNKQGSSGLVAEWPEQEEDAYRHPLRNEFEGCATPGEYLTARELDLQTKAREIYNERLNFGVAREQARKDLPLSNYTEAYWKIDIHNLMHFLGLRMESHAQREIRDYATCIGEEILKPLFPLCYEAFLDYHLNTVTFSQTQIQAIHKALEFGRLGDPLEFFSSSSKSESAEFRKKLQLIGLGGFEQ